MEALVASSTHDVITESHLARELMTSADSDVGVDSGSTQKSLTSVSSDVIETLIAVRPHYNATAKSHPFDTFLHRRADAPDLSRDDDTNAALSLAAWLGVGGAVAVIILIVAVLAVLIVMHRIKSRARLRRIADLNSRVSSRMRFSSLLARERTLQGSQVYSESPRLQVVTDSEDPAQDQDQNQRSSAGSSVPVNSVVTNHQPSSMNNSANSLVTGCAKESDPSTAGLTNSSDASEKAKCEARIDHAPTLGVTRLPLETINSMNVTESEISHRGSNIGALSQDDLLACVEYKLRPVTSAGGTEVADLGRGSGVEEKMVGEGEHIDGIAGKLGENGQQMKDEVGKVGGNGEQMIGSDVSREDMPGQQGNIDLYEKDSDVDSIDIELPMSIAQNHYFKNI